MKNSLFLSWCVVAFATIWCSGEEKNTPKQEAQPNSATALGEPKVSEPLVVPNRKEPASNPRPSAEESPSIRSMTIPLSGAAREKIEHELSRETTFDYLDQPLSDVVADISFNHDIPIVLDVKALEEVGMGTDAPITCNLKGVSLRSALKLALRPVELTCLIRNEVLMITTREEAESFPQVRLYPVSDLLPPQREGDWLVDTITAVVAPETWTEDGGTGSIVYVEHLELLIVRQTNDVMYEIDQLLAALKESVKSQS